ncbi:MAG: type IV pili twitching motility protein PilT [Proteobacteria bacterium]|nr:MAG: type IV pili twitching motility protein PilT [Pseudomonadota bacterium]
MQWDRLLASMAKRDWSDLHLQEGLKPKARSQGRIVDLETAPLGPGDTLAFIRGAAGEKAEPILREQGAYDFATELGGAGRFRINAFYADGKLAVAIRLLPTKLRTIEELGLPLQVMELVMRPRGLLLVTGPTGSGKSTTLAGLINHINSNSQKHIITIEQPIEYKFETKRCLVRQREVGRDVADFPSALHQALRQNPDVIVVGEMRDLETTRTALSAAETGHLVLATLHTSSAARTIERIVGQYPQSEQDLIRMQLSNGLIGILCQQLVPRAEGDGRIAAYEFLRVPPGVSHLIRQGQSHKIENHIQTGQKFGMQLLDDHLARLVGDGLVTAEDALRYANDPEKVAEKLHRLEH